MKSVDEVFPGKFDQKERPDFVWDIFGPPTDLNAQWKGKDVTFSWQPARAVIEVKAITTDFYDRLRDFKPGSCATPLDYLELKLRSRFMKADRQICAARGLIAGHESIGVLVIVNEESDFLTRDLATRMLDRSLREYLSNIDLIVYLHDWCVTEPSHWRRPDGTVVQVHRVSVLGDPSKVLTCLFVKEFKRMLETAFCSGRMTPTSVTKVSKTLRRC